jgi:hypothetical protein
MPRKTIDPALVALHDRRQRAIADFERDYSRLKRVFTRMEKTRARLRRITRRIAQLEDGQS